MIRSIPSHRLSVCVCWPISVTLACRSGSVSGGHRSHAGLIRHLCLGFRRHVCPVCCRKDAAAESVVVGRGGDARRRRNSESSDARRWRNSTSFLRRFVLPLTSAFCCFLSAFCCFCRLSVVFVGFLLFFVGFLLFLSAFCCFLSAFFCFLSAFCCFCLLGLHGLIS